MQSFPVQFDASAASTLPDSAGAARVGNESFAEAFNGVAGWPPDAPDAASTGTNAPTGDGSIGASTAGAFLNAFISSYIGPTSPVQPKEVASNQQYTAPLPTAGSTAALNSQPGAIEAKTAPKPMVWPGAADSGAAPDGNAASKATTPGSTSPTADAGNNSPVVSGSQWPRQGFNLDPRELNENESAEDSRGQAGPSQSPSAAAGEMPSGAAARRGANSLPGVPSASTHNQLPTSQNQPAVTQAAQSSWIAARSEFGRSRDAGSTQSFRHDRSTSADSTNSANLVGSAEAPGAASPPSLPVAGQFATLRSSLGDGSGPNLSESFEFHEFLGVAGEIPTGSAQPFSGNAPGSSWLQPTGSGVTGFSRSTFATDHRERAGAQSVAENSTNGVAPWAGNPSAASGSEEALSSTSGSTANDRESAIFTHENPETSRLSSAIRPARGASEVVPPTVGPGGTPTSAWSSPNDAIQPNLNRTPLPRQTSSATSVQRYLANVQSAPDAGSWPGTTTYGTFGSERASAQPKTPASDDPDSPQLSPSESTADVTANAAFASNSLASSSQTASGNYDSTSGIGSASTQAAPDTPAVDPLASIASLTPMLTAGRELGEFAPVGETSAKFASRVNSATSLATEPAAQGTSATATGASHADMNQVSTLLAKMSGGPVALKLTGSAPAQASVQGKLPVADNSAPVNAIHNSLRKTPTDNAVTPFSPKSDAGASSSDPWASPYETDFANANPGFDAGSQAATLNASASKDAGPDISGAQASGASDASTDAWGPPSVGDASANQQRESGQQTGSGPGSDSVKPAVTATPTFNLQTSSSATSLLTPLASSSSAANSTSPTSQPPQSASQPATTLAAWQNYDGGAGKIVRGASLTNSADGAEMRVELHGGPLGSVEVHTVVREGAVGAEIHVQGPEAHALLSAGLPALEHALSERNLRVESIAVYQDHSGGSMTGGGQREQQSGSSSSPQYQALPWDTLPQASGAAVSSAEIDELAIPTAGLSIRA